MTKKHTGMKASSLRGILITLVLIIVGLAGTGFYFAQDFLRTYAIEVSHSISDATATDSNKQGLPTIQGELDSQKAAATKAAAMLSSSQNYQTQVVKDLNKYAANSGVTIAKYGLDAQAQSSTPATVQNNANPAMPLAIAGGARSIPFTVTVTSPVSFDSLLKFMMAVEQNVPKIQISGVSLERSTQANMVNTDTLTMEVYAQ